MVGVFRPRPRDAAEEGPLRAALIGLLAVTVARLVWLRVGGLDLYPDEAQYWLWSLTPDWGYFSKPPLTAWIIRATTALLGDDEAAIRVAAPLLHFGTALIIFQIAHRLYDARIAAWSAVAYGTMPGVSLSSVIISTDVPLLFCWALALYGFVRAREPQGGRWWLLVGIAGGFGLLAKYAMAYFLISAVLFLVAVRDERRHLRGLLAATVLAFAIYSPNFFWNLDHGFVSYRHTEANADLHGFVLHPLALAKFVGSQFGVFGPLNFASLLVTIVLWRRVFADRRALMLAVFALPTLAMMVCVSLLSRAEPNWAAPTYVSAAILVTAFLIQRTWQFLVVISIAIHVAIAVLGFGERDIAAAIGWQIPGRYDILQRLHRGAALGRAVTGFMLEHPGEKLISDNREILASLIYYVRPHPFDALKWNPGRGAHDQFDLTADAKDHVGESFIYVGSRSELAELPNYFAEVGTIAHATLLSGIRRDYLMVELRRFKGY